MSADSHNDNTPAESAIHDYALGRLRGERAKKIEAFLDQNPDARDRVVAYREEAIEMKEILSADSALLGSGTPSDFALARLIDGSLEDDQRETLLARIATDPDARKRLAEMTRDLGVVGSDDPIPIAPEVKSNSESPPVSLDLEREMHQNDASVEETIDEESDDGTPRTGEQHI